MSRKQQILYGLKAGKRRLVLWVWGMWCCLWRSLSPKKDSMS